MLRAQNPNRARSSSKLKFWLLLISIANAQIEKSSSEISEITENRQNRHFAGNCLWILNFEWSRTDFVNFDWSELIFHVIFEVRSAFSSWIWYTLTYLLISIIVQYTWIFAFWMVYQVFWWFLANFVDFGIGFTIVVCDFWNFWLTASHGSHDFSFWLLLISIANFRNFQKNETFDRFGPDFDVL